MYLAVLLLSSSVEFTLSLTKGHSLVLLVILIIKATGSLYRYLLLITKRRIDGSFLTRPSRKHYHLKLYNSLSVTNNKHSCLSS
jgi:hypothetical protein